MRSIEVYSSLAYDSAPLLRVSVRVSRAWLVYELRGDNFQ